MTANEHAFNRWLPIQTQLQTHGVKACTMYISAMHTDRNMLSAHPYIQVWAFLKVFRQKQLQCLCDIQTQSVQECLRNEHHDMILSLSRQCDCKIAFCSVASLHNLLWACEQELFVLTCYMITANSTQDVYRQVFGTMHAQKFSHNGFYV